MHQSAVPTETESDVFRECGTNRYTTNFTDVGMIVNYVVNDKTSYSGLTEYAQNCRIRISCRKLLDMLH